MPFCKRFSKLPQLALCLTLVAACGLCVPVFAQEKTEAETKEPTSVVAEDLSEDQEQTEDTEVEDQLASEDKEGKDAATEGKDASTENTDTADGEQDQVAAEVDSMPEYPDFPQEDQLDSDANENSEAKDQVRELSVRPGLGQLLPEDSPNWISASPDYESKNHTMTVSSLPVANREDLDRTLDEPLMAAFHNYIDEVILNETDGYRRIESKVDANYIRKNLIDDPEGFVAELSPSNGLMYQKWVRLVVSPAQREQITRWNREAIQQDRIAPLTAGLVAGLVLVGGLHLGLRRRSKGSTTTRMAPEVIVDGSRYVAVPPKTRKKGISSIVSALIALGGFAFIGFVLIAVLFVGRSTITRVEKSGSSRIITVPTLIDGAERSNWTTEDLLQGDGEVTIQSKGRSITIRTKE